MDRRLVKLAFAEGYKAGMLYQPPALRTRTGLAGGTDRPGAPWLMSKPDWWNGRSPVNPVGTAGFFKPWGFMPRPHVSSSPSGRFNPLGTGLPKWSLPGGGMHGKDPVSDFTRRYLLM